MDIKNKITTYNYFPEDFTYSSYESMLKNALEHYVFVEYNSQTKNPSIVLRHDIDFSIENSLKIAEIENKLGIRSYFFINPHSEYYNMFEGQNIQKIIEIRNFGHFIGLHFDVEFWGGISSTKIDNQIEKDKNLLETYLNIQIKTFSFHNTSKEILEFKNLFYGGLINVYNKEIFEKYKYCSDSNGYWRHERMPEIIQNQRYKHLHLLTHPVWWNENTDSPRNKIINYLNNSRERLIDLYDNHLEKNKMLNIY